MIAFNRMLVKKRSAKLTPYRSPCLLLLIGTAAVALLVGIGGKRGDSFRVSNDPLVRYQWHLESTGQHVFSDLRPVPGVDLNIGALHERGVTGKGVLVGLLERGSVSVSHEDIRPNLHLSATSQESGDVHATVVASIIAAVANNGVGGKGVAPEAKIIDLSRAHIDPLYWPRVVNTSFGGNPPVFLPIDESDDDYAQLDNPRAPLFVKSAGNSFLEITDEASRNLCAEATRESGVGCVVANTGFAGSASVRSIEVAAVNASGKKASYSSAGSTLWLSGLGGEYGWQRYYVARSGAIPVAARRDPGHYFAPAIVAADLPGCAAGLNRAGAEARNALDSSGASALDPDCNYTALANGTSSAAPMVTGVVALMLQVNPRLKWRDIKYILAVTARQVDRNQADIRWNGITLDHGWISNAAGHAFSNWYGFGLVDASEAVRLARRFMPLSPLELGAWESYVGTSVPIPYRNERKGIASIAVWDDVKIETVLVHLATTSKDPNNLRISLISPSGTQSILLPALTALQPTPDGFIVPMTASNAFLDERSKGQWRLQIIDVLDPDSEQSSELTSWRLRVLGRRPN